jgi:hypothetical protein
MTIYRLRRERLHVFAYPLIFVNCLLCLVFFGFGFDLVCVGLFLLKARRMKAVVLVPIPVTKCSKYI